MTPSPDPTPQTARRSTVRWAPAWPPWPEHGATLPASVTLVTAPRDDPHHLQEAFAAHRPHHGHITVHPTPGARNAAYLAHDIIRALGKHLPVPDAALDQPTWMGHTDRSWRIAAAWSLTLGVTHLIVCRAHTVSIRQWEFLLAFSAHTRLHLTLLAGRPVPTDVNRLLATIDHQRLDALPAAADPAPHPPGGATTHPHRWPQPAVAFPPPESEIWFRMPPQPSMRHTYTAPLPPGEPDGPTPPLPPPGARQDHTHPHIGQIAARIHSRIAHPTHAACVALRALTGYDNRQINNLHTWPSNGLPPLPAWTAPLMDAARRLAALRGHPDTPNPLSTPDWEHPEIEHALRSCRLLPTPPATGSRTAHARHPSKNATIKVLRAQPTP